MLNSCRIFLLFISLSRSSSSICVSLITKPRLFIRIIRPASPSPSMSDIEVMIITLTCL